MNAPLTGDLTITLADGTQLTDSTDLGLAWRWAEHEYGTQGWADMKFSDKTQAAADALAAIRAAAAEG